MKKTPVEKYAEGLPTKVKVGPFNWTIKVHEGWLPDPRDDEGDKNVWGTADANKGLITVSNPSVFPDCPRFAGVVLHELLHALWWHQALPKKATEEDVVVALESGIVMLFRDNPELARWFLKGMIR